MIIDILFPRQTLLFTLAVSMDQMRSIQNECYSWCFKIPGTENYSYWYGGPTNIHRWWCRKSASHVYAGALLFVSLHFPTGRIKGLPSFCSVCNERHTIGKNCFPILGRHNLNGWSPIGSLDMPLLAEFR